MQDIKITQETVLGMDLIVWRYKSCRAEFAIGDDWATLYLITSGEEGKGHATYLLTEAKKHYEAEGKKFGGSVALSSRMRSLYERLNITEYR